MKFIFKFHLAFGVLLVASFVLAACGAPTPETIEVTRVVEGESVQVTVVVEPTAVPAPVGGTLIESTFADATILNPILYNDSASFDILEKMFLPLVDNDPFSGELVGVFATGWEVSEDGLTYTFNLRDDITWSDGTPMTANDFKFTFDAIASDLVETPRKSNIELVESIEVIDDYTVAVHFTEVDCTALSNFTLRILPSHMYADDFSDLMDSPENTAPTVAAGPFVFQEWVPEDHATLVRNEDYHLGAPNVDGWIYRVFADESARLAALLAGEIDVHDSVGAQFVSTVEGAIASGEPLEMRKFFDDGYTWIAMNQANPDNPQNGFEDLDGDEAYTEGEPLIEQDPHPILGDVAVRQAIAHAVDVQNIVNKVVFGEGAAIASNVIPAVGWAFDSSIEPYEFDLEMAETMLDEAGWVKGADGVRSKDGQRLELKLETNAGNEIRENIIVIVQDTLNSIGFDITAEAVDFSSLIGSLLGQNFDMVLLGWTNKGTDPDDVGLWEYRFDSVGSGFNFTSYYNPEMEELGQAAKTLVGCDSAARAELYQEIQQMLHDDAPYVFLYNPLTNVTWNTRVEGIDPGPWQTYWNVEDWAISP
jgi:peptide/nickel transport system substrate-binding protein